QPPLPFDKTRWAADLKNWDDETRERMADGLIKQRTLIGKTRAEAVDMLGTPPWSNYFPEYDLVYWLGAERGLVRIDSEWLVLKLGPDGRVSEATLAQD